MSARHHDEAVSQALEAARLWLDDTPAAARALVLDDIIGRVTLIVWQAPQRSLARAAVPALRKALASASPFFSGVIEVVDESSRELWDELWQRARRPLRSHADKLRVTVRADDHLHWFTPPAPRAPSASHVVAFLSFKGGVGRTTALASFAIQRARAGEHIVVVDLDLDAPGVGTLLHGSPPQVAAPAGVVDFMLDTLWVKDLDIRDYLHDCNRTAITDRGSISVMGAGTLDARYIEKLSRADLDAAVGEKSPHRVTQLLGHLERLRPRPDWILLDGRAGLSTTAGLLLNGLADLYVLVGTASEQSFAGLERFVEHLGARRLLADPPQVQGECFVVHSMIPGHPGIANLARSRFELRLDSMFRDFYYAAEQDAEDRCWSVADVDSESAPHRPVNIGYQEAVAFISDIDEVADLLATHPDYVALERRVLTHLPARAGEVDDGADD